MAKCPNCKSKVSVWKVLSLMPKRNLIHCQNCKYNLIAEIEFLYTKTILIGMVSIGGLRIAKWVKDEGISGASIIAIVSILLLLYGARSFVKKIELVVHNTGDESIDEIYRKSFTEKEELSKQEDILKFMKQHANENTNQLETIVTEKGWQEAAKIAAQTILEDRKEEL